ncbi:unnamed protein product [Prunus armeniaca]|uniref:Uncharacterized protein n=1 Tax=Prunus armeniaca TaxID=36596 RepID=A0A6J5V2A5_PRUAR|nr:hypothetical protein GBA52_021558 [Prunus armeniaca]CAB4282007.1 unnamed protein product [Prunus armeniaca]
MVKLLMQESSVTVKLVDLEDLSTSLSPVARRHPVQSRPWMGMNFMAVNTGGGFGNINLGVAGADDFVGGADNNFGSGGAQLGENKGGFSLDDPLKGNDRDDDDDAGNFLKRA